MMVWLAAQFSFSNALEKLAREMNDVKTSVQELELAWRGFFVKASPPQWFTNLLACENRKSVGRSEDHVMCSNTRGL